MIYLKTYKLFENYNKYIELVGTIVFDPYDVTKKHKKQGSWKKTAMVLFKDDTCDYYSWLIRKRYNLELNKPLRGPHVSFINDSIRDMAIGLKCSEAEALIKYDKLKSEYNNKTIKLYFDTSAQSDGQHWWINIPDEKSEELQNIRNEIGLGKPYWGLHMAIGYANLKNIEHSKYIVDLINKGPNYL
jgi:hypothetical protein